MEAKIIHFHVALAMNGSRPRRNDEGCFSCATPDDCSYLNTPDEESLVYRRKIRLSKEGEKDKIHPLLHLSLNMAVIARRGHTTDDDIEIFCTWRAPNIILG